MRSLEKTQIKYHMLASLRNSPVHAKYHFIQARSIAFRQLLYASSHDDLLIIVVLHELLDDVRYQSGYFH